MNVKEYRKGEGLRQVDCVNKLAAHFPKYNLSTQSMVENPGDYGVRLTTDAERVLTDGVRKRSDGHRLKGRLSVRLSEAMARRFRKLANAAGYPTNQQALYMIVKNWMHEQETANSVEAKR